MVLSGLALGLAALVVSQRRLGLSLAPVAASAGLYAVAFPVFYWGSFNYVDGAAVGIIAAVLALLVVRRPGLALIAVLLGVMVKESALVATLAVLGWIWTDAMPRAARVRWTIAALAASAGGLVAAALLAPAATSTYNPGCRLPARWSATWVTT